MMAWFVLEYLADYEGDDGDGYWSNVAGPFTGSSFAHNWLLTHGKDGRVYRLARSLEKFTVASIRSVTKVVS